VDAVIEKRKLLAVASNPLIPRRCIVNSSPASSKPKADLAQL
jgi:hypothetical protein